MGEWASFSPIFLFYKLLALALMWRRPIHCCVLIIMVGSGMCVKVIALLVTCASYLGDKGGPSLKVSC